MAQNNTQPDWTKGLIETPTQSALPAEEPSQTLTSTNIEMPKDIANLPTPGELDYRPLLSAFNELGGTLMGAPRGVWNAITHPIKTLVQPQRDLMAAGEAGADPYRTNTPSWLPGWHDPLPIGAKRTPTEMAHYAEGRLPMIGPILDTMGQQLYADNPGGAMGLGVGTVAPALVGDEALKTGLNFTGKAINHPLAGPLAGMVGGEMIGKTMGHPFMGGMGGMFGEYALGRMAGRMAAKPIRAFGEKLENVGETPINDFRLSKEDYITQRAKIANNSRLTPAQKMKAQKALTASREQPAQWNRALNTAMPYARVAGALPAIGASSQDQVESNPLRDFLPFPKIGAQ